MKKDKPLSRELFSVHHLCLHDDFCIYPETLAKYIPDIPTGLGMYLSTSYMEGYPLNPYTDVFPTFAFYKGEHDSRGAVPSCPIEWGHDTDDSVIDIVDIDHFCLDIRAPDKFEHIAWLRDSLILSTNAVHGLVRDFFETEVEQEIFLTHFQTWRFSWMERGCPIYLGAKTTNRRGEDGRYHEFLEEYPLDPNLFL